MRVLVACEFSGRVRDAFIAKGHDAMSCDLLPTESPGQLYQIADIGLRMLQPKELALAQGFPESYILTGSKSCQVAKIGNSVCPPMAKALVSANVKIMEVKHVNVAG